MFTSQVKATVCRRSTNVDLVDCFGRFRKELFVDQLGWKLTVYDGSEMDEFDREDTNYVVLQLGEHVVGGFRAIRADRPYLANTKFSGLAVEEAFPVSSSCWEISRFAVTSRVGRGRLSVLNYAAMFRFARSRSAKSLIALVDEPHERHLSKIGIRTRRYGPPVPIGIDGHDQPIFGLVGEIPLLEQMSDGIENVLRHSKDMEFIDDEYVLGRQKVSA